MLVALISDVHANLAALEIVIADFERERPDRVVCLGDVAATGPQPRETLERLRELGCPTVMGNTDADLLRPPLRAVADEPTDEQRRISEIDHWCAACLSPADLDYVRSFQPTIRVSLDHGRTLLCFHGSPRSFDDAIVATTPDRELDRLLSGHEATVMAGGHTHEQYVRRYRESVVFNPGSVGLNPSGADYALIVSERDRLRVDLRSLVLPRERIRQAALGSGMPHAEWWAGLWR